MLSSVLLLWPNIHRKHSLCHITRCRKAGWKYPSDFQAPPFIPSVGHWGSLLSPAWPDMDPCCRSPRGVLTLQPLWNRVWGTAPAKSAEPAGRVGVQCGFIYHLRSVSCQLGAGTKLVGPVPALQGVSTCWIRDMLAVRRPALLLDVQGRCSPMLCGDTGLGLASTCTLLPWAELTWLHAALTVHMCPVIP